MQNPATFAPYLHKVRPDAVEIFHSKAPENQYMFWEFTLRCEEDDLIIFPSAIWHQVKPQGPTKEPRITISSNIRILSQEEKVT